MVPEPDEPRFGPGLTLAMSSFGFPIAICEGSRQCSKGTDKTKDKDNRERRRFLRTNEKAGGGAALK